MNEPINQTETLFQPLQVIHDLIRDNVQDINSIRAQANEDWIFPTLPESFDQNYPRVAIINDEVRFEEYGSGQVLNDVYNEVAGEQVVTATLYARVAIIPITIGVFVKKNQTHQAVYYDGTQHPVKNTKQVDYLLSHVEKELNKRRIKFLEKNMDIKVTGITRTYEDNDHLFAGNINMEVSIMDVWRDDYDPASIINQIDLTIAVY